MCRTLFASDASKEFKTMQHYNNDQAGTVLSPDVIYHLVEDAIFEQDMSTIFDCARRWVIIYSSNYDGLNEICAGHVCRKVHKLDRNERGVVLCQHHQE
jgi:hypothetical protein